MHCVNFSICLSLSLSFHLSLPPSSCLPSHLPVIFFSKVTVSQCNCLSLCLSGFLNLSLSLCLSGFLNLSLFLFLPFFLSPYLALFFYLSLYLSLPISLFLLPLSLFLSLTHSLCLSPLPPSIPGRSHCKLYSGR